MDRAWGPAQETPGYLVCGRSEGSRARCERKEVHGRAPHAMILLAVCCCNAASSSCHVAWFMALLVLSRAGQRSGWYKSRMANLMVRIARSAARVACQGEGAVAWQGVDDGGWHYFRGVGGFLV